MAALTTTGAGSLGWYFCSFMACLVLSRMFARKLGHFIGRFGRSWASRRKSSGEMVGAGMFALMAVSFFAVRGIQLGSAPIDEEHNVAIIAKTSPVEWAMHSDEEGYFSYRACSDFNNAGVLDPAVGYIARVAKWRQLGDCRSIRDTGLGFWFKDPQTNAYRRIQ